MSMLFIRLVFPVIMTLMGLYLLYEYYQLENPTQDLLIKSVVLMFLGAVWTIFRVMRWRKDSNSGQ
jgi:hypothetical protein